MTTISPRSSNAFCAALLVSASALVGCGGKPAGPATPQGAPIEVGVVTLAAAAVPVSRELPGRTAPFRIAEVRARVTGIVLKRLFEEGSDVKEGQALFLIDPAPYQAAFDAAAATRAHAEAAAANAKLVAARTEDLVKDNAVSRQEADAAAATLQVADADLAAARAAAAAAPPVVVAASDSRAAAELALRIYWTDLANGCAAGGGGYLATKPIVVVWKSEPQVGGGPPWDGRADDLPFRATYAAPTGWKIELNAC